MPTDSRQLLRATKPRSYLNKDMEGFVGDLYDYCKTFFPNVIRDLSTPSMMGMFLEMAAYVGDTQAFYLDHQFHELFPDTAVEARNIERHLNNAGVEVVGAAPAVCSLTFTIEVPVDASTPPKPDILALPVIQAGTTAKSSNGVQFELTEDIDFSDVDNAGNLKAAVVVGKRDANSIPKTFYLSRDEICISGFRATESFSVPNFVAFKKQTLTKENVSDILNVIDDLGNVYYEVEYLTHNVVFKSISNVSTDDDLVKEILTVIPAPYRFIKRTGLQTRLTVLTFGGGNSDTLDNDVIPDPSEFAIPLYGKKTFTKFSLDPNTLLSSNTLGSIAVGTNINITYRYGGGLSHNVAPRSIRDIVDLAMTFPNSPTPAISQDVRASLDVINHQKASGGDDPPSMDELKTRIPAAKASQSRLVSVEDLIARVYTMPSNFGRVFRAGVRPNPNNPLSTQLFIISKDSDGTLTTSPDSLKKNLRTYLLKYRMISDAIDILDARVVNFKVEFTILVDPRQTNKNVILQNAINNLKNYFNTTKYDIDQPLNTSDIHNILYNTEGVLSIDSIRVKNMSGTVGNRTYADQYDIASNTKSGVVKGPPGGLWELKFPNFDIVGAVV